MSTVDDCYQEKLDLDVGCRTPAVHAVLWLLANVGLTPYILDSIRILYFLSSYNTQSIYEAL